MSKRKNVVKDVAQEVQGQGSAPAVGSVSTAPSNEREQKKEVKEVHACKECKFYDHSTERDFRREGIRKGLVEVRAVCRASKEHSKASGHLVKNDSSKPCFVKGVYERTQREDKTKEQKHEEIKNAETTKTKDAKKAESKNGKAVSKT